MSLIIMLSASSSFRLGNIREVNDVQIFKLVDFIIVPAMSYFN